MWMWISIFELEGILISGSPCALPAIEGICGGLISSFLPSSSRRSSPAPFDASSFLLRDSSQVQPEDHPQDYPESHLHFIARHISISSRVLSRSCCSSCSLCLSQPLWYCHYATRRWIRELEAGTSILRPFILRRGPHSNAA